MDVNDVKGFMVQHADGSWPFGRAGWYARRGVRTADGQITVGCGPVYFGATEGELRAVLAGVPPAAWGVTDARRY